MRLLRPWLCLRQSKKSKDGSSSELCHRLLLLSLLLLLLLLRLLRPLRLRPLQEEQQTIPPCIAL
jgi:hypothetical protein